MKRTEALKHLERFLYNLDNKIEVHQFEAAFILDFIENKLGMQPPMYKDLMLGDCMENYMVSMWEDEK